ncbi:hypothetical protein AOLI_G00234470 [Acnodon oligacanthus]
MTIISILIWTVFTSAGISTGSTVTGHRGQSVQIKCPYDSGYETYMKYLCRGECSIWGTKDVPVQSGSAEDQRFSLDDDTAARVFTITITDLRPEDGGTYWCGILRSYLIPDIYAEILLLVNPAVETQTTHPPPPSMTETPDGSKISHSTPTLSISTSVDSETTQPQLPPSPDASSSIILQRNSRRSEDRVNNENHPLENDYSIIINPVYQSGNTSQSDSVFQSVNTTGHDILP